MIQAKVPAYWSKFGFVEVIDRNNAPKQFKPLVIFIISVFFVCSHIVLAEGKTTIAYIGFSTEKPFWVSLGKAVKAAASHRDLDLIDLTPPDADIKTQVKLLEHAIKKQVNGIIIGAISPVSLHQALFKAVQKKIPVIAIDVPIDHPAIFAFVATDNKRGAAMAGQYIVEKTRAKGTVLIIGGAKDHPNGDARKDGVTQKAENAGMSVIFRYADWNDEKAYQITSEELRKKNNITAIFSCWDPGINTASHVIKKMDIEKKIVLVGFDGLKRTREYIKKGKVNATIAQDPDMMAKKSVENLFLILSEQKFSTHILIPPFIVDQNKVK